MKILHVITGLDLGGAEKSLLKILSGLERDRFHSHVVSLTGRGVHGGAIEALGVPLTCLGLKGFKGILPCFFRLVKTIKRERPDIIHTWLYHADFLGFLAARFSGKIPVIWNIRCGKLEDSVSTRSTQAMSAILKRLSSKPRMILFNSYSGMESHVHSGYKPTQVKIIQNGFDMSEWKPNPAARNAFRNKYGVRENEKLVGIVARYHKIKDHECFLRAAKLIISNNKFKIKLVMVGKDIDHENSELISIIDALGIKDYVLLLGPLGDLCNFMPVLDCLVLTSRSEGFPSVLAESLASGVPCVSTDVGDAKRICGEAGFVVNVGDYSAVAKKIEEVIRRSELIGGDAISLECRNQIKNNFSIDKTLRQHASMYEEIFNEIY